MRPQRVLLSAPDLLSSLPLRPMLLHGLYDTLLKKELNLWALLTALASFGWFVWSLEKARQSEEDPVSAKREKARLYGARL